MPDRGRMGLIRGTTSGSSVPRGALLCMCHHTRRAISGAPVCPYWITRSGSGSGRYSARGKHSLAPAGCSLRVPILLTLFHQCLDRIWVTKVYTTGDGQKSSPVSQLLHYLVKPGSSTFCHPSPLDISARLWYIKCAGRSFAAPSARNPCRARDGLC